MDDNENQRLWTEVIELSEKKVRYYYWYNTKILIFTQHIGIHLKVQIVTQAPFSVC